MERYPGLDSLTPREYTVLSVMSDGLTNDGIAARLSLGRKTVEAAASSIFMKLGLGETPLENRRVSAVRIFLDGCSMHPDGSFPNPPSAFIGRRQELEALATLVDRHRFVTIVGPGGIGKTRLAIELGLRRTDPGPARFVDLAAAGVTAVVEAFFDAMALRHAAPAEELHRLHRWLRSNPCMVIIDNAEHVLDDVRRIVAPLSNLPGVALLVTSRVPLRMDGEHVWQTPNMNRADALTLLIDRATAAGADPASFQDHSLLGAWSNWLDGMPLAIELMAHRLAAVPMAHVATDLSGFPDVRSTGGGRHASIRAVVNESLQTLDEDERLLFQRLSVFVGGFSLDVAQACFADRIERDVAVVLERIVRTSLVSFKSNRYRMLEPIRQCANELLSETERSSVEDSLIRWCVDFSAKSYRGFAHDPVRWRPLLIAESGNIDRALSLALATDRVGDALRIVGRLWNFWTTEHAIKGWNRINEVLASTKGNEDRADHAAALMGAGWLAHHLRRTTDARSLLSSSAETFAVLGDAESLAVSLHLLAQQYDEPERFDRPIELAHAHSLPHTESWACAMKGEWLVRAGRGWPAALEYFERAERTSRATHMVAALAGSLRAKANAMLTTNFMGESTHSWEAIDLVAAEGEQIVRSAPGAWQLADIISVRCRNDLRNGRIDDAHARCITLLETVRLTDDPSALAEAALIAAAVLSSQGLQSNCHELVLRAGPILFDIAGPITAAQTLAPRSELYAGLLEGLHCPRIDLGSLLDLIDQAIRDLLAPTR